MRPAQACWFNRLVPYKEGVELQQKLVEARLHDRIPDTFLLLQHPPVITLGRRGRTTYLLADPERLRQQGIEVIQSRRGGDVTCHGPGQWVLYPVMKLSRREMGTHGYLHALEQIALNTAQWAGLQAFRRDGMAGAWCARGKFSAIGIAFTRWVTWHGMSLNVNPDLSAFDLIVGCGLEGERVTSFAEVLGEFCPALEETGEQLLLQAENVFERNFDRVSPESLHHSLSISMPSSGDS